MTKLSENIIRLHKDGLSYGQIQKELNCSKGTVCYHVGVGQKEKYKLRFNKQISKIARFLQNYKQERGCADCKEDYPYWMLDFDHIGDDKSFTISHYRKTTVSLEKIQAEVEKCEVVCANCHRNRTYLRSLTDGVSSIDIGDHYSS